MDKVKCVFCSSLLNNKTEHDDYAIAYECPVCGRYAMSKWDINNREFSDTISKDKTAAYLYHNNKLMEKERPEGYTTFIGSKSRYDGLHIAHPHYHYASFEEINSFWPVKFSDRIDVILTAIAKKCRFFGEQLKMTRNEAKSLLFIVRNDEQGQPLNPIYIDMQYRELYDYCNTHNLVHFSGNDGGFFVRMLSEGWKRLDEVQQQNINNKDVFVSMSFAESTKQTREAIRNGIIGAEFSPKFIDEVIHNRQIVPEMFRLIRACRLLILDISEPNYGAYYEAGYALGLGKEVIISCSAEAFNRKYETEEEKKYERYLKPHFDIAQKQILVWDDYIDLSHKLEEWIKALIR